MQNLAYKLLEDTVAQQTLPLGVIAKPSSGLCATTQQIQGNFALVSTGALHIYPLSNGANTIGRGDDCRIRLGDAAVSRTHAKIVVNGQALILSDLDSTNGTYVNGARIDCTTILRGGDRVRIGSIEFVVAG